MVEIEFIDGGRIIKGVLLGKYQRPHDEVYSYEKQFLWKTKHFIKGEHEILLYMLFLFPGSIKKRNFWKLTKNILRIPTPFKRMKHG